MSLKRGIQLIDLWIDHREQKLNELESGFEALNGETKKILYENEKTVIENLQLIRKEILPNCKHPKKMHDICKGQKYCMSCNLDL